MPSALETPLFLELFLVLGVRSSSLPILPFDASFPPFLPPGAQPEAQHNSPTVGARHLIFDRRDKHRVREMLHGLRHVKHVQVRVPLHGEFGR